MQLRPLIFLLLLSCSSSDDPEQWVTETISRHKNDTALTIPPQLPQEKPRYPWDDAFVGGFPKITKDFFRCKGSSLNPPQTRDEEDPLYDCGGAEKHSLPIHEGVEFIYPILTDLLNHIQATTGKKVVITSGHRCPSHNQYSDTLGENRYSKHMVGAEVSFYVQGLEQTPEVVVDALVDYYQHHPKYAGKSAFLNFERYSKGNTNVVTQPWFNKEIFVKLFKPEEGRDLDNRHPYPYIAIQVKYDFDKQERVSYDWHLAYKNYLRW